MVSACGAAGVLEQSIRSLRSRRVGGHKARDPLFLIRSSAWPQRHDGDPRNEVNGRNVATGDDQPGSQATATNGVRQSAQHGRCLGIHLADLGGVCWVRLVPFVVVEHEQNAVRAGTDGRREPGAEIPTGTKPCSGFFREEFVQGIDQPVLRSLTKDGDHAVSVPQSVCQPGGYAALSQSSGAVDEHAAVILSAQDAEALLNLSAAADEFHGSGNFGAQFARYEKAVAGAGRHGSGGLPCARRSD